MKNQLSMIRKELEKHFYKDVSQEKLVAVLDVVSHIQMFHRSQSWRSLSVLKADELGLKASELIHPTRLALTGRTSTPGLFEIIELLGSKTCQARICNAMDFIQKLP